MTPTAATADSAPAPDQRAGDLQVAAAPAPTPTVPGPWPRGPEPVVVIIVVTWLGAVLPRLLGSLLSPKFRASVGDTVSRAPLANHLQSLFNLLVVVVCLTIIVRGLRGEVPRERTFALAALLAPWICQVARDLYVPHRPGLAELAYPLTVTAVWAARPTLRSLAVVGWLTGITAALSLLLGVALPAAGLYTSAGGDLIAPDKQILPWGILVGMFANGNLLGIFLVLGLPTVACVEPRLARWAIIGVTSAALVWSSSRSSLAALVVGLVVIGLLAVLTPVTRGAVALAVVAAGLAAVVLLPFATNQDAGFTNRGYIWRLSLAAWRDDPVLGLGSDWFNRVGKYANGLPGTAFNGHNMLVQSLVAGGLLYVALLGAAVLVVGRCVVAWAVRGEAVPVALFAVLLISAALEVDFGVVDHGYLTAVSVLPLAVAVFAPLPRSPLTRPLVEV